MRGHQISPFKHADSAGRARGAAVLAEIRLVGLVCGPLVQRAPRVWSWVQGPGDVHASSGLPFMGSLGRLHARGIILPVSLRDFDESRATARADPSRFQSV